MDEEYGAYYTKEVFQILKREFSSPLEEMQKAILIIIKQCCAIDSIDKSFITEAKILDTFFENFWSRKVALDVKLSKMCRDACYSLAVKVGPSLIIDKILISMREESLPYRQMSVETATKIITGLGSFDLDDRQVERLLDGLLYSFQHGKESIFLNGFGSIMSSLGVRVQPHLMQIISALLYRLRNQDPETREQAADLIAQTAPVLKICGEDEMLIKLGTILYEGLGEAYPDVLGSLLGALQKIIENLSSIELLNPPVSQVLATLTPILRNRHEKVQETVINLIGDIAYNAKEYIHDREWMRISFELLEMLKAHKKRIRFSANNTFDN
ncbi:unnamed protein product [Ambrosiozyma monospora]|uniref:Unnamed protein product n=1 Tax=Ambrosiozyma monospora TaxID=43982 RepID=A0ACB5TXU5_AMBMO|nr:unnamed protein product [Ambrosiozyma monospora]